jgi:hypothetical protein
MGVKIIRCKHCRHRFYAMEDHCPECGRRSPQGNLKVFIWVVLLIAGIATASVVVRTCIHDFSAPEQLPRDPEL